MDSSQNHWPELPLDAWRDTYTTLHKWIQVVGKVRQTLTPEMNHWWHVSLLLTGRGITTSPIPYRGQTFDIEFDFVDHTLAIRPSSGAIQTLPLRPQSVAAFYQEVMGTLERLGIEVQFTRMPDEPPDTIPFADDHQNASYDADYAHRWWTIMRSSDQVLKAFRSRFTGKSSPVHFFWHNFDLTATRFSGQRQNNVHPDAARLRHVEADEEISAGFWPGSGVIQEPAYYCFASPEPAGFAQAAVKPAAAFYSQPLGEYILPYEAVRQSGDPEGTLLDFLQSTYEAGANLSGWNREALERQPDNR